MRFIGSSLLLLLLNVGVSAGSVAGAELGHTTNWYGVRLSPDRPELATFWVDSLGTARPSSVGLLPTKNADTQFEVNAGNEGVEYADRTTGQTTSFRFEDKAILIRLNAPEGVPAKPFRMRFNLRGRRSTHATLLGRFTKEGAIKLPAVMHVPGQGTLRISCDPFGSTPRGLGYRGTADHVSVTFPGVQRKGSGTQYRLEVIDACPSCPGTEEPRFDGFRRSWLNSLQLSSKHQVLANHAGSEVCGLCYHEYSEIAMLTGTLAKGVSGPGLLRDSLDRILAGKQTYGMPGYHVGHYSKISLDTWPSLLIAADNYYQATQDKEWVLANIDKLVEWGQASLATDSDSNGLIEYHQSGNLGDCRVRPANWWDCINFGHEDAYSNALAYRAFRGLSRLATVAGRKDSADHFEAAADRLKHAYYSTFYNKATGMLAGWKSRDGSLHDYGFTFIQGLAITYGVVDDTSKANALMDATLGRIKEVGFHRFDLGLPGNLVNVPKEDYFDRSIRRWGGENAFGVYENGGASANHLYYTLAALYMLDRREEGDRILFPVLKSFNNSAFQGTGDNGEMTNDWRNWDGTPWGYEGYLCDNYLVAKAVLVRQGLVDPRRGVRKDAVPGGKEKRMTSEGN